MTTDRLNEQQAKVAEDYVRATIGKEVTPDMLNLARARFNALCAERREYRAKLAKCIQLSTDVVEKGAKLIHERAIAKFWMLVIGLVIGFMFGRLG